MTKQDEIRILRETAQKLGADSYSGAWLCEQIAGIEKDIASDYFPQISIDASKRHCGEMLTRAHDESEARKEAAKKEAEEILKSARKQAEDIREEVARAIHRAQHAINS